MLGALVKRYPFLSSLLPSQMLPFIFDPTFSVLLPVSISTHSSFPFNENSGNNSYYLIFPLPCHSQTSQRSRMNSLVSHLLRPLMPQLISLCLLFPLLHQVSSHQAPCDIRVTKFDEHLTLYFTFLSSTLFVHGLLGTLMSLTSYSPKFPLLSSGEEAMPPLPL